jgi:hypothetical protein
MMTLAGNHEIEFDNTTGIATAFQAYRHRYRMPEVRPTEITCPFQATSYCAPSVYFSCYNYGNAYYSFDAATVHVIMLSSYTYINASTPQYKWLVQDLASVDRKKTPWVVVMTHSPLYNSNTAHQNEVRIACLLPPCTLQLLSPLLLIFLPRPARRPASSLHVMSPPTGPVH